jgi:CheY-like chemotaxis protein
MRLQQHYAGHRILVVDDEPINREVATIQLESLGFIVDAADNGAKAIELSKTTSYAAILMDMQMPIINGLEATRQIRRLPGYQETPIIAMTANAYEEDKTHCLAAGMNAFLVKPCEPEALFETLLHWLERGAPQADTNTDLSDSSA